MILLTHGMRKILKCTVAFQRLNVTTKSKKNIYQMGTYALKPMGFICNFICASTIPTLKGSVQNTVISPGFSKNQRDENP